MADVICEQPLTVPNFPAKIPALLSGTIGNMRCLIVPKNVPFEKVLLEVHTCTVRVRVSRLVQISTVKL